MMAEESKKVQFMDDKKVEKHVENKVEVKRVKTTRGLGGQLVVTEGLEIGQLVITEGAQRARPGAGSDACCLCVCGVPRLRAC